MFEKVTDARFNTALPAGCSLPVIVNDPTSNHTITRLILKMEVHCRIDLGQYNLTQNQLFLYHYLFYPNFSTRLTR